MQTRHKEEPAVPSRFRVTQLQLSHPEEPRKPLPEIKRLGSHPPRSKRLVSKGAYAANVGKKAVLASSGVSLYLLGLSGFALLLALLAFSLPSFKHPVEIGVFVVIAALATGTFYVGRRTLHKGVDLDTGVPLTRANTGDLPASDSLVRASAEPIQEQQALLLRAATDTQERHEEQLVRASTGGTEQG